MTKLEELARTIAEGMRPSLMPPIAKGYHERRDDEIRVASVAIESEIRTALEPLLEASWDMHYRLIRYGGEFLTDREWRKVNSFGEQLTQWRKK